MGTRATYKFIDANEYKTPLTIYIHWDGYPEGAATYFVEALKHENGRGGMAQRFLRANHLAKLTESHDVHGDTDYRYTYTAKDGNLVCQKRTFNETSRKDSWTTVYEGSLAEFIWVHTRTPEAKTMGVKAVFLGFVTRQFFKSPHIMLEETLEKEIEEATLNVGRKITDLYFQASPSYVRKDEHKIMLQVNSTTTFELEHLQHLKTSLLQMRQGLLLQTDAFLTSPVS